MNDTSSFTDTAFCYNCRFFDFERKNCNLKNIQTTEQTTCACFDQRTESNSIFQDVCTELGRQIVGEEKTIHTIFLVMLGGSLVQNCEPTSSNLLINDLSGSGKDYILSKILDVMPEKRVYRRKRISEKVLTYWHNTKSEPSFTWDNKILYLEDCSNNVLNSEVFKVLSSSSGIFTSTILINQIPVDIEIKGKPVLLLTIASPYIEDELLRRFPVVNLDISKQQTTRILKYKANKHKTAAKYISSSEIKTEIEKLISVYVSVPFADAFINVLDHDNVLARTSFDRLIDYVKFSAAIHQNNRIKAEDGSIIANEQDYNLAKIAIENTFNKSSVPLTRNQKTIYSLLEDNSEWLSVDKICELIPAFGERQVRRELSVLVKKKIILLDRKSEVGVKQKVYCYKVGNGLLSLFLPSFKELLQNYDKGDKGVMSDKGDNKDNSDRSDKGKQKELTFDTFDTDTSVIKSRIAFDYDGKCSISGCGGWPCTLNGASVPFCRKHWPEEC